MRGSNPIASVAPGARATRHKRAARLLADDGADAAELAPHLLAALAVAPLGGAWAQGDKATKLTCTLALNAQGAPNPSGIHFGFAKCPRPFGKGLHYYNSYTVTPTGPGQGTVTGAFKNYYNLGTARGRVTMTFAATSPMNVTYKGTVTYTGGTGKFRHVKGSGTIECTTSGGGAHKSCSVNSKLTGL